MNQSDEPNALESDLRRPEIQVLEDGRMLETMYIKGMVSTRKYINPDGSYEVYSAQGYKTIEETSDGTYRVYKYQSDIIDREIKPDKTIVRYHDNGAVSSIERPDKTYESYYDNGNLYNKREKDYEIALFKDGRLQYEFKDGILSINPEFFSYYRIGMKSKTAENHWTETGVLDPSKKTLLCLGGDQTREPREANGNINAFANVLGLSQEQLDNMQLCSCYRPSAYMAGIMSLVKKDTTTKDRMKKDYKREILQKFMPFMASVKDGKFERYSKEQLYQNFRNIIIQAHCYGANDLTIISDVLKETMAKLKYSEKEINKALKQVICVTNNSQREFNDQLGFTAIHRYSVTDGQFEPEYETRYSAGYPVFLASHEKYKAKKGTKAAVVPLKKNEALMIFDKVLVGSGEHNSAFWTTLKEKLTSVGYKQAELMKNIGRFWYSNVNDVPDVIDLVNKCSKGIEPFVKRMIDNGRKLAIEQRNPLVNHSILKSEWNKYKDNVVPENFGVFKVLAERKGKSN